MQGGSPVQTHPQIPTMPTNTGMGRMGQIPQLQGQNPGIAPPMQQPGGAPWMGGNTGMGRMGQIQRPTGGLGGLGGQPYMGGQPGQGLIGMLSQR